MICCPTSKVAKPHILGAIYRVEKADSAEIKDPRGLDLDWKNPEVGWLTDERPAVVKRAIDALAHESRVADLRSEGSLAAVWSLHRIAGEGARQAVRSFLGDGNVAAIRSVALWRDTEAVEPLIGLLTADDSQQRRLAAMALGKIGDDRAVQPLLNAGSGETDPFLRHAILYALYEIGDTENLLANDPIGDQVRLMHEVDRGGVSPPRDA